MHDGYVRSEVTTTGAERMGLQRLTPGPGRTGKEQCQALLNGGKQRPAPMTVSFEPWLPIRPAGNIGPNEIREAEC